MTQYSANLNKDAGGVMTPARYDDAQDKWIMDVLDPELENVKAELEEIKSKLTGQLDVKDADMLAELKSVESKLTAIETRLDQTLDVKVDDEDPLPVQLKGSNVRKVFIPFIFGGDEVIEVTSEGRVQSEYISLSNYKTIDIIITTEGSAGLELDVNTSFSIGGYRGVSAVYDWVEDDWMGSYFGSSGEPSGTAHATIGASSAARRVFILSTHPNFYWLNKYPGHEISLNFLVKDVGEGEGLLRAYVVGDPIV